MGTRGSFLFFVALVHMDYGRHLAVGMRLPL